MSAADKAAGKIIKGHKISNMQNSNLDDLFLKSSRVVITEVASWNQVSRRLILWKVRKYKLESITRSSWLQHYYNFRTVRLLFKWRHVPNPKKHIKRSTTIRWSKWFGSQKGDKRLLFSTPSSFLFKSLWVSSRSAIFVPISPAGAV